jgi:hypothetical protein
MVDFGLPSCKRRAVLFKVGIWISTETVGLVLTRNCVGHHGAAQLWFTSEELSGWGWKNVNLCDPVRKVSVKIIEERKQPDFIRGRH